MTQSSISPRQRLLVYTSLCVTGACGLIYELTWQRYLANFLGSEAKASALILSVFLGGLALGYAVFGRLSYDRSRRWLIRLTGVLELGIGLWAVLFPQLYALLWSLSHGFAGSGMAFDLTIAMVLIGPPTVLMGGTLPLLTQAFTHEMNESGRVHSWIYFLNTAGAFAGCALAGFLLLPSLGLGDTALVAALFNWMAGVTLLLTGHQVRVEVSVPQTCERGKLVSRWQQWPPFAVAFGTGAVCITLQIALTRAVGLAVGSSEYAFALVVALFIALLAAGAHSVSTGRSGWRANLWLNQLSVAAGLVAIYFSIPYWPYCGHVVRALLTSVAPNFFIYHLMLFGLLALVLGVAIHGLGRTMPLLFATTVERLEDLGRTVGSLYFVNTVGCVGGGLVGGYLAFYVFDLDQIIKGCLLLTLLTSVFVTLNGKVKAVPLAISMALSFTALGLPRWNLAGLKFGTFRLREATVNTFKGAETFYRAQSGHLNLLYHRDGPNATMSVLEEFVEGSNTGYPSILVNGKSDGSTLGDMSTMKLMAHIPALFSTADLGRVAVIGFGTGVTVGSLGLYPQVQAIHVFEMSPLVSEYAAFFDRFNHYTSKNEKVKWHIGDAYRELLSAQTQYGLIASEPSNPWVTGVERLYSREFLTMAAEHLAPGGVYAQWFHEYDMSQDTVGMVINTFGLVFPEVRIFRTTRGDLLILGAKEGTWNERLSSMERKWTISAVKTELADLKYPHLENLLLSEISVPKQFFASSGVHTLEFPKLSYRAGYEFFLGTHVDLGELENAPIFKSWGHHFADRSLSSYWLRLHPDGPAGQRMLFAACGEDAGREPFEHRSSICQKLYLQANGAWIRQFSEKFDPLQARVVMLVKGLGPQPLPSSSRSATDSERALKFMMALDSPGFLVRKDHILEIAKPCFIGSSLAEVSCRIQVVRSLAAIGEVQAAYGLFSASKDWIDRLPGESRKELIDLILESSRANKSL